MLGSAGPLISNPRATQSNQLFSNFIIKQVEALRIESQESIRGDCFDSIEFNYED